MQRPKLTHQNIELERLDHGRPFWVRLTGMGIVGMSLFAISQTSHAASVHAVVPTSQRSCLRSMHSLIDQSKGSATRVDVSITSPTSTSAVIYVSDGEVQIICDATAREMTIKRVLDVADDEPVDPRSVQARRSL